MLRGGLFNSETTYKTLSKLKDCARYFLLTLENGIYQTKENGGFNPRQSEQHVNRSGDEKQATSKFGKIKNLALLIGTLAVGSVAGALNPGERGYADSTNWWNSSVISPELPITDKNLALTSYITDPTQSFTNENTKVSIWGKCPDGTNQLLTKREMVLEGPYGNQTGQFFLPFQVGKREQILIYMQGYT